MVFKTCGLWGKLFSNKTNEKGISVSYKICGDAMLNFSSKSISKFLRQAGFNVVSAYRWEKKTKSLKESLRDVVALLVYFLSFGKLDFCPGLITVAVKK